MENAFGDQNLAIDVYNSSSGSSTRRRRRSRSDDVEVVYQGIYDADQYFIIPEIRSHSIDTEYDFENDFEGNGETIGKIKVPLLKTFDKCHLNHRISKRQTPLRMTSFGEEKCDRVVATTPIKYLAFTILFCLFFLYFLGWRYYDALDNNIRYPFVWFYLIYETIMFLSFLPPNMFLFSRSHVRTVTDMRCCTYMDKLEYPTVDVFICCCGEEIDIIQDTVLAALGLDYAKERFNVYLLDDGADKNLYEFILSLKSDQYNVDYICREKVIGQPHHAKAGNINNAASLTSGEFIVNLDADMIVMPNFLMVTMPYMKDELVGMVQTPQMFYNIPDVDPFGHCPLVISAIQSCADFFDSCPCTGTGFLLRREAFEDIGGFVTNVLTEDYATSLKLCTRHWKTKYCHTAVQWGLAPDTLAGVIAQRQRWCMGNMQMVKKAKPWQEASLPLYSRLIYSMGGMAYIAACGLLGYVVFPIIVNFGAPILYLNSVKWILRMILGVWIGSNITTTLLISHVAEIGYLLDGCNSPKNAFYILVLALRSTESTFWMAPYFFQAVLQAFAPPWLRGKLQFKVTGTNKTGLWNDFVCLTPYIVISALSIGGIIYKAKSTDFSLCLDIGEFITIAVFQMVIFMAFIMPIIHVMTRWKSSERCNFDREKYLIRDENNIPRVNVDAIQEATWKSFPWYQLVAPSLCTLWLIYAVYITSIDISNINTFFIDCYLNVVVNGTEYKIRSSDISNL